MSNSQDILILYLTLALCATIQIRGQPTGAEESVNGSVKFYVFTRQNLEKPQVLEANVESVVRNVINPMKPTTLAVHNVLGDRNAAEYTLIRDTKLHMEDGNVILVDYSALIDHAEDFVAAVAVAPQIADAIADLLVLLHNSFNLDFKQLHVVGSGLGGQISGLAGQNVYARAGEKIQRITALDPAGNVYTESTPLNERLSADDGEFVEVVHTNAGQAGFLTPCGHVDYYPNGGKVQPGCNGNEDINCSHIRAYELIPDMWLPQENHELLLLKCPAMEYMGLDYCRWLNEKMGDLQHRAREGVYYLETNSAKPFGKGAFRAEFF